MIVSLVDMTTSYQSTRSSTRSLKFTSPTFPASASEVLDHVSAWLELQRVATAAAFRKGLNPEEIVQESALRIVKADRTINDFSHWTKYCATVAFSRCSDEWRKRFRRPGVDLSLDEANELGSYSTEQKASLTAFQTQLELEEEWRMAEIKGTALARLIEDSSRLPAAARRVLELLLEHAANEDSYMKNGRLNGNAIAAKAEISQSTISRQLPVIQAAAVELLDEMSASDEMEMW